MKNLNQYITEALKIKSGTNVRYNNPEYFCHEALEDGYTTKFKNTKNILQYSIDNCKTWDELKPDTETPEINKGKCIYFKGEDIKCKDLNFGIGTFVSNKNFNASGNIMSLIYGDNFKGQTKLLEDYQFNGLFFKNEHLISAKDLILPSTELREGCYGSMFNKCSSLIDSPKLPATKVAKWCYQNMFSGCNELVNGPEELPATTLERSCYSQMFMRCSSLEKAPILPAKKLVEKCYYYMFSESNLIKYVTMLATDVSAKHCLHEWLPYCYTNYGHTFTKSKNSNIKLNTINGIPANWKIKEI